MPAKEKSMESNQSKAGGKLNFQSNGREAEITLEAIQWITPISMDLPKSKKVFIICFDKFLSFFYLFFVLVLRGVVPLISIPFFFSYKIISIDFKSNTKTSGCLFFFYFPFYICVYLVIINFVQKLSHNNKNWKDIEHVGLLEL